MIRLKVTPIVGLPQFTGWSQVAESTSSANTRLICVFAISGKHAGNVGRDVADQISDFYYYDIEQLHDFLTNLVEFVKNNDCQLFISCALINGEKSIFVTKGGSVFLKRKEKIGQILSSKDEIRIVKGRYTKDDVFVLTTYQASQFLNEIEQKFLQGFDVDIIITSIVPGLHAQPDSSLSAIVFINQSSIKKDSLNDDSDDKQIKDKLTNDVTQENFTVKDDDSDLNKSPIISNEDRIFEQENKQVSISADLSESSTSLKNILSFLLKVTTLFKWLFKKILIYLKTLLAWFFKIIKTGILLVKDININKFFNFFKLIKKDGIKTIFKKRIVLEDEAKSKNWFKIIIIFVIVITILTVSLFLFINNNKEKQRINLLLEPINQEIVIAKKQLEFDPILARDTTSQIISKLEKLKAENKKSNHASLIDDKLNSVSLFYKEISGKKELDELNIFYDLRLIKADYIANDIDLSNGKLIVLDSEKKQVVVLDITTKKVSVKDFSSSDWVRDIAINDNTVFVLSDGLKSFDLNSDKIQEVRQLGDSNRDASFINAYDRFVYVVNPVKHNVYRYLKEKNKYSDPIGWMRTITGLEYNKIASFSVDGNIWFSTIDGKIQKFTSGKQEDFQIRGLSDQFSNNIILFTNKNLENIYVLESAKNRIVVLSKTGEFKKEIKSPSLKTVGFIAVSEKLNKIFAVSGSIIFDIDLNK